MERPIERPSQCWPAHPCPLPGELFSSWLLRSARANHLKLSTFVFLSLGNKTVLRRDMERTVTPGELNTLARWTAQLPGALHATTLRMLEGTLTRKVALTAHTRWVLPFRLWSTAAQSPGLAFCPLCLGDREPYYRLLWRCSFAPVCPEHRRVLLDRCPFCLTPVQFHRLEFGYLVKNMVPKTPITTCFRCQGDLREGEPGEPAAPLILLAQERFTTALRGGAVQVGTLDVPPLEFADVAYELLGMLCRNDRLARWRAMVAEGAQIDLPAMRPGRRSRYFEALQVEDRVRALTMLGWLLQDWPLRLVSAAKAAGLSRSQFTRHLDPITVPGWFSEALFPLNSGHGRPRGTTRAGS